MSTTNFGAVIRAARDRLGESQEAFARRVGISQGHLSELEKSGSHPTIATLEKICEAIGWECDVVMGPRRKRKKNN